jgi:hypothetical protein
MELAYLHKDVADKSECKEERLIKEQKENRV